MTRSDQPACVARALLFQAVILGTRTVCLDGEPLGSIPPDEAYGLFTIRLPQVVSAPEADRTSEVFLPAAVGVDFTVHRRFARALALFSGRVWLI